MTAAKGRKGLTAGEAIAILLSNMTGEIEGGAWGARIAFRWHEDEEEGMKAT